MAPRKAYESQLHELNNKIVRMGHMIEERIASTLKALIQNDKDLAGKVMSGDDEVDLLQVDIEKDCATLIAHQQPIASDLRFILSVIKIVTDMERIADQCCDICEYSIKLKESKWNSEVSYQRHVEKMARGASDMLKDALDYYVKKDVENVLKICRADDDIDTAFERIWEEISQAMKNDPQFIQDGLHYIMIIKYLERIADHITNIAEWTYYSLTGEYVIHQF